MALIEVVGGTMFEKFMEEMKTRPYTMVLILIILAGMWTLWSTQQTYAHTFARADDLNHLRIDVTGVKYSVEKASIESQLRQVDEEFFRLERQTTELKLQRKDVPALYEERMSHLTTDKEALKVNLASVQAHINQLTAPPSPLVP
jgi:chromosome segregation ATPase